MSVTTTIRLGILLLSFGNACAGTSEPEFSAASEIAKLSGLPPDEVSRQLADCSANQQSMNFCAWRDQVEADHALDQHIKLSARTSTVCADAVRHQVGAWRRKRDAACAQDSAAQGGSEAKADFSECQASMTSDYARHYKMPAACVGQQ